MVDTELIASQLRAYGHEVTHIVTVPNNAGIYEFTVDGKVLSLDEARELLTVDEKAGPPKHKL